jgi:hypothetical protein
MEKNRTLEESKIIVQISQELDSLAPFNQKIINFSLLEQSSSSNL